MINEKIISEIGLSIKKMILEEITKLDFIFKGKINEIKEENKVLVRIYEDVVIEGTVLKIGSKNHFLQTKINKDDDVIVIKTANSGNLVIVFSLPLESEVGFALKSEVALFEEREERVTLQVKEESVFEELKSALKEIKAGLVEISDTFQTIATWSEGLEGLGIPPVMVELNIQKIETYASNIEQNINKLNDITV